MKKYNEISSDNIINFKQKASLLLTELVFVIFVFFILVQKNNLIVFLLLCFLAFAVYILNKRKTFIIFLKESYQNNKLFTLIVGIIIVLLFPLFLRSNAYILHVLIIAQIQIILALGLNYQVGSAGIPNLGFAGFFGIGAYASSLLAVNLGVPFWIGIIVAGLTSALLGLILGLPTLKSKSYYLALITIAFGLVMYALFLNLKIFDGPDGVRGIPAPSIFGWSFFSNLNIFGNKYPIQFNFYYLSFIFLAVALLISYFLYNSRIGLIWNALREDEIAARSVGINTTYYKTLAFCTGCFYGGVAGSIFAHYIGYISAQNFTMTLSLTLLSMVILGGLDNILGVTLAAFLLTIIPEKFRFLSDYRVIAYAVIIILMLIFRTEGLMPQKIRNYLFLKGKILKGDKNG